MQKNQSKKEKTNPLKDYAKYSSLAFQMAFIIAGGTWLGYLLDKLTGWRFPVFIVVFALLSVGLAIYYAVKDL
jgi:F0F1-type ATP synthase assembly protein I